MIFSNTHILTVQGFSQTQMKSKSESEKSELIRQEKPKRDLQRQDDKEYEKDLMMLISLRQQNKAIKQGTKNMKQLRAQYYEDLRELQFYASCDYYKLKKDFNKVMLLQVLEQREEIRAAVQNISNLTRRQEKRALREYNIYLNRIENEICLVNQEWAQYVEGLRLVMNGAISRCRYTSESDQQTVQPTRQ